MRKPGPNTPKPGRVYPSQARTARRSSWRRPLPKVHALRLLQLGSVVSLQTSRQSDGALAQNMYMSLAKFNLGPQHLRCILSRLEMTDSGYSELSKLSFLVVLDVKKGIHKA